MHHTHSNFAAPKKSVIIVLGPNLQCLFEVREDLSEVLFF